MDKFRFVIFLFLLISCQSAKITQIEMNGEFYYLTQGKDFRFVYNLILEKDSTFSINIAGQKCNGVWAIISNENEILLKCESPTPLEPLSRGYLSIREYKLKILNPNEIQIDSVILERKFFSN